MLLLALPAFAATLAECERAYDTGELHDALRSAELRYAALDAEGFGAARQVVHTRLGCVKDPLTQPTIGRVHRLEVLAAFLGKEYARLDATLASLIAADPAGLPTDLVPEGHPVRDRLDEAAAIAAEPGIPALPALESGWVEVDGTYTLEVPPARPVLLQRFDAEGQVTASWYRWPDQLLGEWGAAPEAPRKRASFRPRVLPGVHAGAGFMSAGEPDPASLEAGEYYPTAFAGAGAHLAARLELALTPAFALAGELGYRNLFGEPTIGGAPLPRVEQFQLQGNNFHLGYAALGVSARVGRLTLGAAPMWGAGAGHITGLASEADIQPDGTYQRVSFVARVGGGTARVGWDVLRGPAAALTAELEGGAASTGDRGFTWASVGLTYAARAR